MCGIAGVFGNESNSVVLGKMLTAQAHRGPDNTGIWVDQNIAIGHNRLSIIDLSVDSNQPFIDNSGRYILSYNGEIYNYLELRQQLESCYEFKTNSDSEVLLAAYIKWGKDCLSRFNGMFSFIVYDSLLHKLFAARDRFGVKPFYYFKNKSNFYFASEIKSLHAVGIDKIPNKKAWANYLVFGSYGLPNETFWESIEQLAGGHFLELDNDILLIKKWYHFEKEIKKYKSISYLEAKKEYTRILKDSIKLRFRADVEVGFNVSGGLDSSALLAFVNLNEGKSKIKAFTFYTGNSDYDELPWVEEMISITKNPLHKVLLSTNKIDKKITDLHSVQDEPFGGIPTLAYAQIFKTAREKGVIVLLDGQGMDEQWAGYDYYLQNSNALIQGVNKSPFRPNVLHENLLKLAQKPVYPKPFNDDLLNLQYRDLFYTKIPRALRFNDRVSMAYSTELREPFLDYRLVEFAFAQPIEYKINKNIQKYMLREIVSEHLSDKITYAPKRPLQTPQREWLGNELSTYVDKNLNKLIDSKYNCWFNVDILRKEWKKYKDGDNESSFHIWQWVSLTNLLIK
ncbi:asparagine synthase (glutamine-hydrolyzing) [Aureibaculum sp. 2210JD6-5]|uniref:asparagine synthase (glutamine-hydrolyzing) n=1 Tax=Aureibaculum sp. 2210JD6-5 TaxID=3103957 RepID=UPI002AACB9EE|nr:asparagine synthase (glutamine-hydrolyzing) [Aureibaculum sp. 2210JD6-5]MDY7394206.1 asparagine synthase (glutamine-hydrolyzing) [Aureibaculum sp. 2210JD6-5]